MKRYHLLCFVLFCGLVAPACAQEPIYIGKISEIVATYKKNAQAASTTTQPSETQIRHLLPGTAPLVLEVTTHKQQGITETFYGDVYNVPSSRFYLKISGREASGAVIMIKQKKYYAYSSTPDGSVYLTEKDIDKVLCVGLPSYQKPNAPGGPKPMPQQQTSGAPPVAGAPPVLESLPGAGAVVYLDFDGQTVSGTLWNSNFNSGNPIVAAPSTMSVAEMIEAWKVMSEDFRPFALNVTTSEAIFNNAPVNRRMRVIFTPTNYFYPGYGGVAYIGSFTWGGTSYGETPCWIWNTGAKASGETGSHETGHTLQLGHDGRTNPPEEYFYGQANWAPIMGAGFTPLQVQWSKGEYPYANNTEDDLDKISTLNGFGYRADDHGNDLASATPLVTDGSGHVSAANNKGVITTRADVDVFSFTTAGGLVGFTVNPDPGYPDLDVYLTLRNAAGTALATADPATPEASISANLAAGTYYLTVDGTTGVLGANSDYASIGAYTIATKDYCVPVYTDGCITYATLVNNFSFNNLVNNNSGCGGGTAKGYTNYAPTGTFTTAVTRGKSYTISMLAANYPEYFGVWIDYNRDKDFDDAGEFVFTSTAASASQVTATITIPATAALGTTRMRVRSNYDPAITSTQACAAFTYGEAEDYTITINNSNAAPTVSLTVPANGATFTAPATINLAATAADPDGTVSKVEFFQGTTKLGEDLSAPYSYSWSGVAAGTYSLTAKATDNLGTAKTSAAVSVIVKVAPPTITTFRPTSGPAGIGVMIKGTNFVNISAVRFNGVAATTLYKASPTLLYATVPTGATTGKIQVVAQGGSVSTATNFTIAAIGSSWWAKAGLRTARLQHGTIATGGKIYVFGGKSSANTLSSLEIYNPSTNAWSAGAPMPVATRGMAVALGSNGSIYLFGGVSSAPLSTVYRYVPSTNTWAVMASMPVALFEAAAAATSNGKIYVFGGEPSTAGGTSTNATYIYTISTNTWTRGANLPVGVQQQSAITGADGKIYVIGGRALSAKEPLGLVQVYNPSTNTWSSGAPMLIPKVQFGATRAADGRIYVIGGKAAEPNSTGPFFHTVEIYNPTTNTWTNGPVLPVALGQQTAVRLNDNLYAVGGSDNTIRNACYQLILVPVAPASLTAAAASSSQVNLKWTDKSLNESGFVVERATAAAGPFAAIASVGANVTALFNTGLTAGKLYYYRVKATNSAGSSVYSNTASATTMAALLTTSLVSANKVFEPAAGIENTLTVHPNPVHGSAQIAFSVTEDQAVRLDVYDMNGRAVANVFSGTVQGGKMYRFTWHTGMQAAGMYFSRLVTQKGMLSQKMVVFR